MRSGTDKERSSSLKTAKTVGWAAFLFFLIKGLLWLIVPALFAYYAIEN